MKTEEKTLWKRLWRVSKYLYLKVMRTTGSPEYIARGAAIGIFVCFFFPVGFQTIPSLALAFLLKGAKIPAFLLTWLSNYATAVFFYPIQCYVGGFLTFNPISYQELMETLKTVLTEMKEMSFGSLFQLGWELTAAFLAGGLFFGLLTAIPGYFLIVKLVRKYQEHRKIRRRNIRKKILS